MPPPNALPSPRRRATAVPPLCCGCCAGGGEAMDPSGDVGNCSPGAPYPAPLGPRNEACEPVPPPPPPAPCERAVAMGEDGLGP